MQPVVTTDLLLDIRSSFVQAAGRKRFVNFLVDSIVLQIINNLLERYLPIYPSDWVVISSDDNLMIALTLTGNIILYILINCCFVAFMELFTDGRTIGKYLTGTRAVYQDGRSLDVKAAFLRALIKLIPFEAFSALGAPCYPWHDRWTKTYVIDIRQSVIIDEQPAA